VEGIQTRIADMHVLGRLGEFEPSFNFSGRYESNAKPQNTQEFVATHTGGTDDGLRAGRIFYEDNWRFETGVKGKLPFGTEYGFTVDLNELRNTLNIERPPSRFYPEYESFAGFKITQPLLRDFGYDAQLAGLRVAQADRRLAGYAWRLKVEQTVAGVMKNYYDLVFASEDTRIKSENIKRAKVLEQQNQTRVDKGVGSQVDVQQATVAASVREEELIAAQYLEREKANLLLRDLVDDLEDESVPRVRAVHTFKSSVPSLSIPDLMRDAMANRTELQQAREQLEKQEIKIRFAKNQTWPRLDVFGTLGANGLQATAGDALSHAFDRNTPSWSAGVMITIPLGNMQAKAQLTESKLEKEQIILSYKQLEVDLALQVDTALARVRSSEQRLATARKSVEASGTTLEAELKRLEQGVGISFNVLEAQKDLASASTRELAAKADLNKSLVELWLVTGTLLQRHNIALEIVPPSSGQRTVITTPAK
jgi:outer membrane protein TolC